MTAAALLLSLALAAAPVDGGLLRGRVVDGEGNPVPSGTRVEAVAPDAPAGSPAARALSFTEAGGVFVFEGLGPFPYRVTAGEAGADIPPALHPVPLRPGAEGVVVRVARGFPLEGRLTFPRRVRPKVWRVILRDPETGEEAAASEPGRSWEVSFRGVLLRRAAFFVEADGTEYDCGVVDLPDRELRLEVPVPLPDRRPPAPPKDPPGSRRLGRLLVLPGPIPCRVEDERGRPVEGAEVAVFRMEDGGRGVAAEPAARGATDADGLFTAAALEAARYEVRVRKEGYAPRTFQALSATQPPGVRLSPGWVVSGVVVAADTGEPVARISVQIQGPAGIRTGMTGPDGSFELGYVPPGPYALHVGGDPARRNRGQGFNNPGDVMQRTLPDVAAGTRGLRVELERGAGVGGVLVDREGEPLPGEVRSRITARLHGMDGEGRVPDTGLTGVPVGEDGSFRAGSLPPGRYALVLAYANREAGEFVQFRPVPVEAGRLDHRVVVPLGPGIRGRVVDGEGRPVAAGTPVHVRLVEGNPWGGAASHESSTTATAADGTFRTGRLDASRDYQVHADAAGFGPCCALDVAGDAADLVLVARPGASIAGVIVDEEGVPVRAGVRVGAVPVPLDMRTLGAVRGGGVVEAGGAFRVDGLEPGRTYRVSVDPNQGYVPVTAGQAVAAGAEGVTLAVRRAWHLAGVLLDGDGKPVPWVSIEAEVVDRTGFPDWWRWTAFTDAEGKFRVDNLPAGPVVLNGTSRSGEKWYLGTHDAPAEHLELHTPPY